MIKDEEFKTLVNIVMNKPEYISYVLKFIQAGMLFIKPETLDNSGSYDQQKNAILSMNLGVEEDKVSRALEQSEGDMQIAIRFLFQSKYDTKLEF